MKNLGLPFILTFLIKDQQTVLTGGQYDVKFYEPNTNFNLFKTLSPTLLITILIGLVAIIKLKRL